MHVVGEPHGLHGGHGIAPDLEEGQGRRFRAERDVVARLFAVPARERRNVKRLFDIASASVQGFEAHARQIARLFRHQPKMREEVLEALFHVAAADGVVHPSEMHFLERVAEIFRLSHRFRCIRARCVRHPADVPYQVLGANPCDSDEEIRQFWRRPGCGNHPDRLLARGMPEVVLKLAHARMAAINAAWEAIRAERQQAGMRVSAGGGGGSGGAPAERLGHET